jgi:phosphatidylserine decarboxylase
MVTIDREAAPATAVAAVPALVAALAGRRGTALVLAAVPAAVALFFRDPDRTPDRPVADGPVDVDTVLSPADGKVKYAGPGRAPYGGRLREVTYRPGKWLAAYSHESAHLNERTDLVVEREVDGVTRTVQFRQIVGLMARRVVTRVAAGDEIATGQRIGLMKFGSRMDVFVPTDARLLVEAGARVVAGETVIARWPSGPNA